MGLAIEAMDPAAPLTFLFGTRLTPSDNFIDDPAFSGFTNNAEKLVVSDRLARDYRRAAEALVERDAQPGSSNLDTVLGRGGFLRGRLGGGVLMRPWLLMATVVLLFERGRIHWDDALKPNAKVQLGRPIAQIVGRSPHTVERMDALELRQ